MRGSLWRLAGAPLLVIISLYQFYSHIIERRHRNEVLAHGADAQARVLNRSGAESLYIEWVDSSGARRTGQALAGKPFGRQVRAGQDVAIKYLADSAIEPVILSQTAERERVNEWWITASLGLAIAMAPYFCADWRTYSSGHAFALNSSSPPAHRRYCNESSAPTKNRVGHFLNFVR